jgi:ribosomal protein L7/L12
MLGTKPPDTWDYYEGSTKVSIETVTVGVDVSNLAIVQASIAAYKRAIEILEHELDYKEIVYRIAKNNPMAFVEAIDGHIPQKSEFWVFAGYEFTWEQRHDVLLCLQNGEKIQAIKQIRTYLGCGLKEAKDVADAMQDQQIWLHPV